MTGAPQPQPAGRDNQPGGQQPAAQRQPDGEGPQPAGERRPDGEGPQPAGERRPAGEGRPDGEGRQPADQAAGGAGAAAAAGARRRLNTGGLIYGTIVTAAALAVGSGKGDTPGDIADAMAATVIIYWLAHLYTAMLSGRAPGSGTPLRRRLWKSAREESAILGGGLPAVVIFIILWLAGVALDIDLFVTVCVTLVMLAAGGFLAGRQAGIRSWRLGIEVAGAAAFGLLLALLMVGLH